MERSWQNTSNNSTGFIYFNTNTNQEYQNKSDTADFLAFSDSPQVSPQQNRFKPSYYSSPQAKFHRGSSRNYPQNNRRYQRWSGGNRSLNSSYNSDSSQNTSFKEGDPYLNIEKYLHPSFLEDPWAPLEAKLEEQRKLSEEMKQPTDSTAT